MCYERRDPNVARECWERDQGGKKMAEYIEREALLEDIENTLVFSGRPGRENPKQMGARLVVQRIRNAPAEKVAPIVHGRWVPFHSTAAGDIWYCSACDVGCTWRPNYCPNCGARMDGTADV